MHGGDACSVRSSVSSSPSSPPLRSLHARTNRPQRQARWVPLIQVRRRPLQAQVSRPTRCRRRVRRRRRILRQRQAPSLHHRPRRVPPLRRRLRSRRAQLLHQHRRPIRRRHPRLRRPIPRATRHRARSYTFTIDPDLLRFSRDALEGAEAPRRQGATTEPVVKDRRRFLLGGNSAPGQCGCLPCRGAGVG